MNTYKIASSAEHRGDTFLIVEIDGDGIEHDGETRFATWEAARDAIDRRMERNLTLATVPLCSYPPIWARADPV